MNLKPKAILQFLGWFWAMARGQIHFSHLSSKHTSPSLSHSYDLGVRLLSLPPSSGSGYPAITWWLPPRGCCVSGWVEPCCLPLRPCRLEQLTTDAPGRWTCSSCDSCAPEWMGLAGNVHFLLVFANSECYKWTFPSLWHFPKTKQQKNPQTTKQLFGSYFHFHSWKWPAYSVKSVLVYEKFGNFSYKLQELLIFN